MSAATLLELAERCVNATGSLGRDFDADVFEALGYEVKRGPSEPVSWRSQESRAWAYLKESRWHSLPHLAASLDAALTLGDKRMLWCVGKMEEGPFARVLWPQPNGGYVGGLFETNEETEVGALLSALLRARAAMVKP